MKKLLTLLFFVGTLLNSNIAWGKVDCNQHKIYCKIMKLQPKMNKSIAMALSDKIYHKSKRYEIDPFLSLAILNTESDLKNINTFKPRRKQTTIRDFCTDIGCFQTILVQNEILDMTLAQINVQTAKDYGLDVERLLIGNIDYALEAHYIILKDKIKRCARFGVEAWSCYHSATPKYRLRYIKAVRRSL